MFVSALLPLSLCFQSALYQRMAKIECRQWGGNTGSLGCNPLVYHTPWSTNPEFIQEHLHCHRIVGACTSGNLRTDILTYGNVSWFHPLSQLQIHKESPFVIRNRALVILRQYYDTRRSKRLLLCMFTHSVVAGNITSSVWIATKCLKRPRVCLTKETHSGFPQSSCRMVENNASLSIALLFMLSCNCFAVRGSGLEEWW